MTECLNRLADGRMQIAGHDREQMARLESILLAIGGERLLYPQDPDSELKGLIRNGKLMDGPVKYRRMKRRHCHSNVAALWLLQLQNLDAVCTGYALSEEGLWVQHSWGLTERGLILETTVPRTHYFGLVLRAEEADVFAIINAGSRSS